MGAYAPEKASNRRCQALAPFAAFVLFVLFVVKFVRAHRRPIAIRSPLASGGTLASCPN
jgi:hypothetical protein